jgi:hypothetical protein
MNITSPTTVGVENTQPPVSNFQRSSGAGIEEMFAPLLEVRAQFSDAIVTKTTTEMRVGYFFIATPR